MTEKKMEHKEMRVDEDELEAMHTKLMEKRAQGWAGARRISCSQVAHTTKGPFKAGLAELFLRLQRVLALNWSPWEGCNFRLWEWAPLRLPFWTVRMLVMITAQVQVHGGDAIQNANFTLEKKGGWSKKTERRDQEMRLDLGLQY